MRRLTHGALEAGGKTVAVLGSGLDMRLSPASTRRWRTNPAKLGAVVSELPAGAPPQPAHFPLRNRIISGLCTAVVVVEACERSGSLITARIALEQGRDVLAVPGGIAVGPPSRLPRAHKGRRATGRDGGRRARGARLEQTRRPSARTESDNHLQLSDLEANMAAGEPYAVDDLARADEAVCLGIAAGTGRAGGLPAA